MLLRKDKVMKKYLLPKDGNFYKANLHCHTTVSDGKLTPEELKEHYKAEGYSVVAYTDHNALVPHPELRDESFLPLNGYEADFNDRSAKSWSTMKTCHICVIALDPDNLTHFAYHRTRYTKDSNRDKVKFDESAPDFERSYTPECINSFIKMAKDAGFFVTYNHPTWSLEGYADYSKLCGLDAMEIFNTGCVKMGFTEYNPRVYDDLLRLGNRIGCLATDDNHNDYPFTSPYCDSFGGYTMIKADKLEYKAITDALVKGNYYASCGPRIESLFFEDGKITVKTSPCKKIAIDCASRATKVALPEGDALLTEATFRVSPEDGYARVTLYDEAGNTANTRAYFTDELFAE